MDALFISHFSSQEILMFRGMVALPGVMLGLWIMALIAGISLLSAHAVRVTRSLFWVTSVTAALCTLAGVVAVLVCLPAESLLYFLTLLAPIWMPSVLCLGCRRLAEKRQRRSPNLAGSPLPP